MARQLDLARDYPCSWDQNERLTCAKAQMKPRYKIAMAWSVADRDRLEDIARAWRTIVMRHPALRVAYAESSPGYWRQRVLPYEAVEHWCVIMDDATDAQLAVLRSRVGLHTGQLFSVALVRRSAGIEVHFTVDHVCIDSWSLGVIIEEWGSYADGGETASSDIETDYFEHCLNNPPSPGALEAKREEWQRVSARTFPPYAQAPLRLAETSQRFRLEAAKIRIPWDSFPFDARACAAGIGPALLAAGLEALCGSEPGEYPEYPMIGVVAGRTSHGQVHSVGAFSSWLMLPVPVLGDDLATRSRKASGRLLNALRRPPTPFALETAIRCPELVAARHWPYHRSPRYLYTNHLKPLPAPAFGGNSAKPIPVGEARGFGLAKAITRSAIDALELEFTTRADLLSAGAATELARFVLGQCAATVALSEAAE
jgi:hypothetical protein